MVDKQRINNEGGCTGKGFVKGTSGNSNGRPKKERCFSDIARKLLDAHSLDIEITTVKDGVDSVETVKIETTECLYYALVTALIKEGLNGNTQAINQLIDRADGKVKEKIEMDTKQVIKIERFNGVEGD